MSKRRLIEAFLDWKAQSEVLVLATVIETGGSTYSKPGDQMLLSASGSWEGMLSGGCLEGDLADHARAVLSDGTARIIDYDLSTEADELWGMGIGCDGSMRILLQKLDSAGNWQPFTAITELMQKNRAGHCALVVDSSVTALSIGASLVRDGQSDQHFDVPDAFTDPIKAGCDASGDDEAQLLEYTSDEESFTVLHFPLWPWPRLLLLGAGPDAIPLIAMAGALGWEVTVADHREAYIQADALAAADERKLLEPARLAEELKLNDYSAVVIMSHQLDTDRRYLQQLSDSDVPYIGLLGPAGRRRRLLGELGEAAELIADRLYGPVGLDIGADSAESIALSILAEAHAILSGHSAASLTPIE